MLFGTTNDFVILDPASIKIHSAFPDIKITDFKVLNNPLNVDSLLRLKEIELEYNDNSLTIEFSPLLYNSGYLVKYKLDPLDKNWKTADKNYQAIYNYLPPGTYSFMLKTMDEEGNESTQVKQLQIKVNPPFWKTWWFFSLFALAAGALLFWLDKERMKRKEAIHKMRADIAVNLHEEINTALSNINILSEMSKLKAVKEPEKSIEFIDQIHTRSQNMMIAMDDMLWGINPDNDSLTKAIERVREHLDGLSNQYAVRINLEVDKKVADLKLNMKLKQDVVWFFKNGAANIVRTGATNCNIHIGYTKPDLIYTIEFDNADMNMQQLNNLLQRQELADKLTEVKGTINMQVHSAKSQIELTIPVN
jgi:signal transduction histidine kinase